MDYKKAWELLYARIDEKNSWGKVQLKELMLECLLDIGRKAEEIDIEDDIPEDDIPF